MTVMFDDAAVTRIADLLPFLHASTSFSLRASCPRSERARWIRERLMRFLYRKLHRKEKAILRSYLCLVTGLSERALKYHVTAERRSLPIPGHYRHHRFAATYTSADQEALAETDTLHGRLNGAATIALMQEEERRGNRRYERLKHISVGHLYNLRQTRLYREHVQVQGKTKATTVRIGERRRPAPQGRPGYLRVDSVHQGDKDGEKGVYHINLVDEVLQWQIVLSTPQISESALLPVLEEAIALFPFIIAGFHSDNGSEYINHTVAALLTKLHIAQTKSRSRRSTDNGLVESKNGHTIRKTMGHWHINQAYSERINQFYRTHFIPYLNFHRPCAFPMRTTDARGRVTITYPKAGYCTPYRKFLSLKHWRQYLKPGITPALLEQQATAKTPHQAAREMQTARQALFAIILQPHSATL